MTEPTKTYYVEVVALVEVMTGFEIKAVSKEEAEKEAESLFENNITCSLGGLKNADHVDYGVSSINTSAEEEETRNS